MPGCVLRAYGRDLAVDRFLEGSALKPLVVWGRGEKRFQHRPPNASSGMKVVVSDASGNDLPLQINEAMAFLNDNRDELVRLRDAPGVEYRALDFGIVRRDVFVQCDYFPPKLVKLAAEFGLGIELSQDPPSEDEAMEKPSTRTPTLTSSRFWTRSAGIRQITRMQESMPSVRTPPRSASESLTRGFGVRIGSSAKTGFGESWKFSPKAFRPRSPCSSC
jgi:hypothetical protein